MEIGQGSPADYPALAALTEAEGWNYSVKDFQDLDLSGCGKTLVAKQDGSPKGMVTIFDYGDVGWISNLLVYRPLRGKGLGSELLRECVRQFGGKRTIALFSYQESKRFYLKEGMKQDRDFSYVKFVGGRKGSAREGALSEGMYNMDERAFGYRRKGLLRMLMGNGHIICPSKGPGFAILRPDPVEATVGPVVAEDGEAGLELLYASFNILGIGSHAVVPEGELEGVQELFRVSRLYYGEKPFTDFSLVKAFSGLEFG
jgi:GNAT superfamily N-acetyltransferase